MDFDPRVQVCNAAPNVHTHFLEDDDTADERGYAEAEICCHACGVYIRIKYTLLPKDSEELEKVKQENGMPVLNTIRDKFLDKHRNCIDAVKHFGNLLQKGNNHYKYLCPPWRKYPVPEIIHDLRNRDLYDLSNVDICEHGKHQQECGFCRSYDDTQGLIKKDLLED